MGASRKISDMPNAPVFAGSSGNQTYFQGVLVRAA